MGSSAGGHLASTAGTHFDHGIVDAKDSIDRMSCRPDFMILMYPVITFTEPSMHKGSRDNLLGSNADPKIAAEFSNELQVTDDTPPAFIVHADDDKGVPVESTFFSMQHCVNIIFQPELHIYSEGGHGFALGVNKGHIEFWPQACRLMAEMAGYKIQKAGKIEHSLHRCYRWSKINITCVNPFNLCHQCSNP